MQNCFYGFDMRRFFFDRDYFEKKLTLFMQEKKFLRTNFIRKKLWNLIETKKFIAKFAKLIFTILICEEMEIVLLQGFDEMEK